MLISDGTWTTLSTTDRVAFLKFGGVSGLHLLYLYTTRLASFTWTYEHVRIAYGVCHLSSIIEKGGERFKYVEGRVRYE